jgi:hypothetical protein
MIKMGRTQMKTKVFEPNFLARETSRYDSRANLGLLLPIKAFHNLYVSILGHPNHATAQSCLELFVRKLGAELIGS